MTMSLYPAETADRLRSLINHCYRKVPHFRSSLRDLPLDAPVEALMALIPLTDKKHIQDHWQSFIADGFLDHGEQLITRTTTGSTGRPLRVVQTRAERFVAARHLMKARLACGLTLPARIAALAGVSEFMAGAEDLVRTSTRGGGVLRLSCADLSDDTIEQYLHELKHFQPTWLYSFPSTIMSVARFMRERRMSAAFPGLQLLELRSEFLSDHVRAEVEDTFGIAPRSQYACQETWGIAFECPRGRMHVLGDHVFLEVLGVGGKPAPLGEIGEAVISGLNRVSMPFLRYRLGDLLSIETIGPECGCGNPYPVIRIVGGRTADEIVGHPGKVGALLFDASLKLVARLADTGVQHYRVVQRRPDAFDVLLVCKGAWTREAEEIFERTSRRALGAPVHFTYRLLEEIPRLPLGKEKTFVVDLIQA